MKKYSCFSVVAIVCVFAIVALMPGGAGAALYKCKGTEGRHSYVDNPDKCAHGSTQLNLPGKKKPAVKKPVKKPVKKSSKKSGKKSSPSAPVLPSVSPQKQTAMDKKRVQILLYELNSETRLKNIMDSAMKITSGNLSKQQVLQQQRNEHARNIIAIRQELARHGIDAGYTSN